MSACSSAYSRIGTATVLMMSVPSALGTVLRLSVNCNTFLCEIIRRPGPEPGARFVGVASQLASIGPQAPVERSATCGFGNISALARTVVGVVVTEHCGHGFQGIASTGSWVRARAAAPTGMIVTLESGRSHDASATDARWIKGIGSRQCSGSPAAEEHRRRRWPCLRGAGGRWSDRDAGWRRILRRRRG